MLVLLAACSTPTVMTGVSQESQTLWLRPTPRPPVDTATALVNLSNLPGADVAPSVAVHPEEGWAAVIWANVPPERADTASVFVKVQDPVSGAWQPGISVNTTSAYSFASHPDVAIDHAGRVHAVFGQDHLAAHYSRSDDHGRSWTTPERLLAPADSTIRLRVAVDNAGDVHLLLNANFHTFHLQRPAGAAPGTPWESTRVPTLTDQDGRGALAFLGGRTLVAVASGANAAVATRDNDGDWTLHPIAGAVGRPGWSAEWTSLVTIDATTVCVAFGYWGTSGNYSSCSFDRGDSWEAWKPIIETLDVLEPGAGDIGHTPSLIFEPLSRTLLAVQLYRQSGAGAPVTVPVFSLRRLAEDHWIPDVAGPFAHHTPPFRLFVATTPHNSAAAPHGIRVAYAGPHVRRPLALAVWVETDPRENVDVYAGWFNPAALVTEVR
ncbi:MAG: hypothetical protein M3R24_25240 [Chloroflexota bacterium]|nr:hypothetical protein [Chloroflexota bacterium]